MKLYYLLGRLLSPFGIAGLITYSYLMRTKRVRLVVKNEQDELLLVQTWLGGGKWGLPGGGVDRGESPEAAALRELYEETGVVAAQDSLERFLIMRSHGHDEVVFMLRVPRASVSMTPVDRREIEAVAWFSQNDLPRIGSLAKKIIDQVA